MESQEKFLVILTKGDEDGGEAATLAFAFANSALSLELDTTIFLTGKGVLWGQEGSAGDINLFGFGKLQDLIRSFLEEGGHIISCGTCVNYCALGSNEDARCLLEGVKLGGLASVITLTKDSRSISF
jgi:predicted peroxiredoxin